MIFQQVFRRAYLNFFSFTITKFEGDLIILEFNLRYHAYIRVMMLYFLMQLYLILFCFAIIAIYCINMLLFYARQQYEFALCYQFNGHLEFLNLL